MLEILSAEYTKAFATVVSLAIFSIGLINNELKKLRRDIKPLHDIFDFEKKLDSYIAAPNYSGSPPEISLMKRCFKDVMENRSIWNAVSTRTLLRCTHSKDLTIKKKALEIISKKHCSEDSDCWMISQAIDFPTSLYLARVKNVDMRLFRPPIKPPGSQNSLETELMKLMETIPNAGNITNYQQLIHQIRKKKIHASSHIDKTIMLGFETYDEMGKDSQRTLESIVVIHLLQAVLKYSEDSANCKCMADQGILVTLRQVFEQFQEDLTITELIFKILNNIILSGVNTKMLFETGWFHIIVRRLESKSESDRLLCLKLLMNMEMSFEDKLNKTYDNRVCLLHPVYRAEEKILADVVFIHGIRGGAVRTWRQRDKKQKKNGNNGKKLNNSNPLGTPNDSRAKEVLTGKNGLDIPSSVFIIEEEGTDEPAPENITQCWPKDWLSLDLHNARILSVEYDTKLTQWTSNNHIERKTLREQAELLLNSLSAVGVGQHPLILVGHSMGEERQMNLLDSLKGIVFYSVPHRGSNLVNRTRNASYLLHPSDILLQLAEGSTDLKDLHDKFSDLVVKGAIKLRSFTEGESTDLPFYMKATIVSQHSSDPGFGEFYVMKDHDHITICKPKSKDSLLYILTRDFMRHCLYE